VYSVVYRLCFRDRFSSIMNSLIGKTIEHLPTPAAVVDIEALDHNLGLLAGYFASRQARLRPHFKSHKCVTLAKRQLAAGAAVGITCAKLAEAEALVAGGVPDILIANQVIGREKAARLAALNRKATVRCAVDTRMAVEQLGAAATSQGVVIGVLVEVDVGMRRCGLPAGEAVLELARLADHVRGVRFDGLQAYEGHLVMKPDFGERKARVVEAMQPVLHTRSLIEETGLACPIISGGGTGTYEITGNIPGFSEIQAGSYALMDCQYKKITPAFENAMCILATVISATSGYGVADVGLKGMGNEFGMPVVIGDPNAKPRSIAEEHVSIDNLEAAVGDKIRLIPSHGCTTSNLHRRFWVARKGVIEAVWPIEASGALE
jgi:D-serine deaminase-like pyridoxal phosphate-dependent protein